jgi:class 3 adenylate cyclase/tetratricopeptide (TPR) repeat protein
VAGSPPPVVCLSCGFENPAGGKFCGGCGTPLTIACPRCRASNSPTFKFCSECGASLAAAGEAPKDAVFRVQEAKVRAYTPSHLAERILTSAPALEGERKAVTVLFADVAGFTRISSQVSAEDLHLVMDGCFERLSEAVHGYEGTINQFTGDGIMALFGAPIAHEDHAERAVHAALAIQDAMAGYGATLARERGVEFRMRIGLNSGTVVVGKIGDNLRMDYTAQGDTVNLAARLEQACLPGTVLVSDTTRRLAAGAFTFRTLPPLSVKGKDIPVVAHEVIGPQERRGRVDVATELTPLVGRQRELGHLQEALDRVRHGRGEVVGIVGEAGVGKSRILLEFRQQVAQDVLYLEGKCISYGQSIPLLPIVELLKRGFRIVEGDREDAIREKVVRGLHSLGADARSIAFLLGLLGVETEDATLRGLAAEARRRYTFEALRALAIAASARRPIVFAVEDLHWIDPASQDFLRYLAENTMRAAVLILVTHRPGYAPPWSDRSYYSQIVLSPLSEGESERVVESVLRVPSLPAAVKMLICQKAEGNPFYLEEITRSFLDTGILARANGGYELTRPVTAQDVPDTVQGVIMARIDRLAETRKRTIQTAAVIGREFAAHLLGRIADIQGRLEDSLTELRALEFIYEKTLFPDLEYVFKHALVQDVAYGSLLKPRRRALHELVGRAIEELYADRLDEHVAELSHHFAQGEVWPKAFAYARRAGDRARAIFANREAIHFYTQALHAAGRMSPPPDDTALLGIHEARGSVWHLLSNNDQAVADFEAMQQAAARLGDRVKEGEALCNQAGSHWWRLSEAYKGLVEKCAREAMVIAEETGDERILARGLYSLAMVDQKAGALREADAKLQRSVEICRRRNLTGPLVTDLTWLGAHASWRGEYRASIERSREAASLAESSHEGFYELVALCFQCNANMALGNWDVALRTLDQVRQKSREREAKYGIARSMNTLGSIHHQLGDVRHAVELNEEARDFSRAAKLGNPEIYSIINLADDHLALGEIGAARGILIETAERLQKGYFDSHLWKWQMGVALLFARLFLLERDLDRVEIHLGEALEIAGRTESRRHLAEGRRLRGELMVTAGRTEGAQVELRRALEIAESTGSPRTIWETAGALARALGSAHEDEARATYARAVDAIRGTLPRIPTPDLKASLLGSETLARILDEAAAFGITLTPG